MLIKLFMLGGVRDISKPQRRSVNFFFFFPHHSILTSSVSHFRNYYQV